MRKPTPFSELEQRIVRKVWPRRGDVFTANMLTRITGFRRDPSSVSRHAKNTQHLVRDPVWQKRIAAAARSRGQVARQQSTKRRRATTARAAASPMGTGAAWGYRRDEPLHAMPSTRYQRTV